MVRKLVSLAQFKCVLGPKSSGSLGMVGVGQMRLHLPGRRARPCVAHRRPCPVGRSLRARHPTRTAESAGAAQLLGNSSPARVHPGRETYFHSQGKLNEKHSVVTINWIAKSRRSDQGVTHNWMAQSTCRETKRYLTIE